jgi:adenine-specific DNA-methyltransferase
VIKYLGSKRKLIPQILEQIGEAQGRSAIDLFSGTSRVGHALKERGFQVFSNDYNRYAETLARCYVEADAETHAADAQKCIAELNQVAPAPGYFTTTFCEQARYFHPKNGARIDAIREKIADWDLPPTLEAVVLTSLMEAADRVDSTCGVQMAYLKSWAPRAHNALQLRVPKLLPRAKAGPGKAWRMDARDAASFLKADVAYLDPPYNQHSYLGNYHVWETLVKMDEPEVYGVAQKRTECKTKKSDFNFKSYALQAFYDVVRAIDVKTLVVSFNNEGYVSREEMEALLCTRGMPFCHTVEYSRYVGAQIGIHNLNGEKVGQVSHLKNKEFIFVVDVETPPIVIEEEAAVSSGRNIRPHAVSAPV